jgi:hypothetical protein
MATGCQASSAGGSGAGQAPALNHHNQTQKQQKRLKSRKDQV